jgi:hypothetical protein
MHEFYHRGVVIVLMWCHDWPTETKEMDMTDYNSMKADGYAQRQGEMDDIDNDVVDMSVIVESELPDWVDLGARDYLGDLIWDEAKRRVMQAIKEGNEP